MKRLRLGSLIVMSAVLACFPLTAQNAAVPFFIQLADTQFGAFTNDRDFTQETVNYEFAVANINRLKPSFVVICGDLINKVGDPVQTAEYHRITAMLDKSIPVYPVSGNHDVGNEPTPETLAYYRQHFGRDYYSFRQGDIYGIVLNSSMISAPAKVQDEADKQEAWLKVELATAKGSGARHIVVFQHHSFFLEDPNENTQYFNIPKEQRRRFLDMLKLAGVRYVFAGHYHRNAFGQDEDLQMITNGPVGRPLGNDPSGIRVVSVLPDRLEHTYFTLGNIPNAYTRPRPAPAR
jgi:3',5'-cyclic AMP phosphodiesterase CpdA